MMDGESAKTMRPGDRRFKREESARGKCLTRDPNVEPGPQGTIAYYMRIESSRPGLSIETNQVFAGRTPLSLKVFGDVLGTFHNFGNPQYVVLGIPAATNEFS